MSDKVIPLEMARHKAPPETWAILKSFGLIDEKGRLPDWIEEIQTTPHGILIVRKAQKKWSRDLKTRSLGVVK